MNKIVGAVARISPVDEDRNRVMELQWMEEGEIHIDMFEIPYLGDGDPPQPKDAWQHLDGRILE